MKLSDAYIHVYWESTHITSSCTSMASDNARTGETLHIAVGSKRSFSS